MKKLLLCLLLSSCSVNDLSPTKERIVYYVKSDGAELPVEITGANTEKTFLFVHGGPGLSSLLFSITPALRDIRKEYRVVLYDQRGSGGARGHATTNSITLEQNIKDLDLVIDSVKTKFSNSQIYLVGHSYGGIIASGYASVYQSKIKALLLISPVMNIPALRTFLPKNMISKFIDPYLSRKNISHNSRDYWSKAKNFYSSKSILELPDFIKHNKFVMEAEKIQKLSKSQEYYKKAIPILLQDPLSELTVLFDQLSKILASLGNNDKEKNRNLETDPVFNVANITIPVYMMVGKEDLVVPPSISKSTFDKFSSDSKTLFEADNVSHSIYLENVPLFVGKTIEFINSH